jgi:hypothetical protein
MLQLLAKYALAGAFDDNEVRILVDAFDRAWKSVQENGIPFPSKAHANATRELLALRIIDTAELGEPGSRASAGRCAAVSEANEPQEQRSLVVRANLGHGYCPRAPLAAAAMRDIRLLPNRLPRGERKPTVSKKEFKND